MARRNRGHSPRSARPSAGQRYCLRSCSPRRTGRRRAGLEAAGWRELPNPNKPENTFSAGPDGAVEVVSQDSVSTLFRPVEVDLAERPILTWRWRVDEAAPATDLSAKGQDDCSLAVYVGFPYDPEQASFFERLKRPLVDPGRRGRPRPRAALRLLRRPRAGRHGRRAPTSAMPA